MLIQVTVEIRGKILNLFHQASFNSVGPLELAQPRDDMPERFFLGFRHRIHP